MFLRLFDLRAIGSHAATIWVGQLAVMAFAITDTLVAGRFAPEALAALSVGTAIYISIYVGLQGFVQALLPIWAQLHGAGKPLRLGYSVRQSLHVTAVCAVLGMAVLLQGGPIMRLVGVPAALQPVVSDYLAIQALTLPLALLARVFNTFSQSIGRPQWVTGLQAGGLLLKIPLSIWFTFGGLGVPAMGLPGCALATFITHVVLLALMGLLLRRDRSYRPYQVWQRIERPDWAELRSFVHLGLPSSIAIWVEVTAFTMMSLLVAPMGTTAAAAQQIASNLAAVLFMWPLSLAIATSARVSYWRGARQPDNAVQALRSGLLVAATSAALAALLLALLREPLARLYVQQASVAGLAASLLLLVALYHLADAMQVMALFLLRCYHVVTAPTAIYTVLLWGIGIGVGSLLAYGHLPLARGWAGPQAFWGMSALAMGLVAAVFLLLLRRVAKAEQAD